MMPNKDMAKVVVRAKALFPSAFIEDGTILVWGQLLDGEPGLKPIDVDNALDRIVKTVHPSHWRLEFAEILLISRDEREKRMEREAFSKNRVQIPAMTERHVIDLEKIRKLRKELEDRLCMRPSIRPEPERTKRVVSQTVEEAEKRRAELARQVKELENEKAK